MEATKTRASVACSPIVVTQERQHFMRMVGRVVVLVTGPDEMTDIECQRMIEGSLDLVRTYGTGCASITYSPTQVPSAKQRAMLSARKDELLAGLQRSAMVTDSALVRGGVTALGWLMRGAVNVKMYHSREVAAAALWTAEAARQDGAATYDALCEVIIAAGYRVPR